MSLRNPKLGYGCSLLGVNVYVAQEFAEGGSLLGKGWLAIVRTRVVARKPVSFRDRSIAVLALCGIRSTTSAGRGMGAADTVGEASRVL